MFKKFSKLIQGNKTSDHPLGSRENLDLVLGEIPSASSANVLLEVGLLIDDVARYDDELSPAALRQAILHIDDYAREAYADQLLLLVLPISREHGSDTIAALLERHNRLLYLAYMHCLEKAAAGNEDLNREKSALAICATRAMQAWVECKKLHHFRYRPPDAAWWQGAHKLISVASQLGAATLMQIVYPGETQKRSMLHAYLSGLYMELVPTSSLIMPQIEILQRWLQQHAGSFEFTETPNAGTTHFIDLANPGMPQRYKAGMPHTATHRYCSTTRVRTPLMQFARVLRREEAPPEWLGPLMEQRRALTGLIQILLLHWSDKPPQRRSEREPCERTMRVVYGFGMARRMIACTDFAKRGKTLRYEGVNYVSQFRSRFGDIDPNTVDISPEEKPDPMETLLRLETMGDKQMMDEWTKVEASATGFGANMPGLRNRHRIGEIVGYRFDNDIEWRLGIIRRISRTLQMRIHAGIEVLPVPSLCAQVRVVNVELTAWSQAYEAGTGHVDAILPSADSDCLILPPGLFAENLLVSLIVSGQKRNIVLTEKLDQGGDWERIRFREAAQESA